jgi:hypothetical protein
MGQSISRGSIRADLFVQATEVRAPDLLQDRIDALPSMERIVAGRPLRNNHNYPINPPTVHERGCLPLLPLLGAAAPHKDAVARITAE